MKNRCIKSRKLKLKSFLCAILAVILIVSLTVYAEEDNTDPTAEGSSTVSEEEIASSTDDNPAENTQSNSENITYAQPRSFDTAVLVKSYSELKTALEGGATEVKLDPAYNYDAPTGSIETNHIGSYLSSTYIDHDITIYGQGATLNMNRLQFRLKGSHTLRVENLTITKDTSVRENNQYVFNIREGSTSAKSLWNAEFYGITLEGSALLGTYTNFAVDSALTRYFDQVTFADYVAGDGTTRKNELKIANRGSDKGAVIYARNIVISGEFDMHLDIGAWVSGYTGVDTVAYHNYFLSPGVTTDVLYESYDAAPNTGYGSFVIADNANVNITRDTFASNAATTTAHTSGICYYKSIISGYRTFDFGKDSSFNAKAGTNLYYSSDTAAPTYRSAVIRSNYCTDFNMQEGAQVYLETMATYRNEPTHYGTNALMLKSQDNLDIYVAKNAKLEVYSPFVYNTAKSDYHNSIPVYIWGSGRSETIVEGEIDIKSETGSAWGYEYHVGTTKYQERIFHVKDGGVVNLTGNNDGTEGGAEYAAFSAYGNYDTYLWVDKGAEMNVIGKGYRAISLAGSTNATNASYYPIKQIKVAGKLQAIGWAWAIAAEEMPQLEIAAYDGGDIYLQSNGGQDPSASAKAASTVYSVGTATYNVESGSRLELFHNGGAYGTIFHDGYGPLNINVSGGSDMIVRNINSGDRDARRAAITTQNTTAGALGQSKSYITVEGVGSTLDVTNENDTLHVATYEIQRYPTGAISFDAFDSNPSGSTGEILVKDGASFYAVSNSLSPTIYTQYGKVTFDNPGDFEIRNDSTLASTNGGYSPSNWNQDPYSGSTYDYATVGQAVWNGRSYYDAYENSKLGKNYTINTTYTSNDAVVFKNCDVTVWGVKENDPSFFGGGFSNDSIDAFWENVSFSANCGFLAPTGKNGTLVTGTGSSSDNHILNDVWNPSAGQFATAAYGRINGNGANYKVDITKRSSDETKTDGLVGAEFILYRVNASDQLEYYSVDSSQNITWSTNINDATTLTTGNDGKISSLRGLSFGVTYYLKETKAPANHTIISDGITEVKVTQTAETQEQILEAVIYNEPVYLGSITIQKFGEGNQTALNGATFLIERYDGNDVGGDEIWTVIRWNDSTKTWDAESDTSYLGETTANDGSKDGIVKFANLKAGKYRLTETSPPQSNGVTYAPLKEPIVIDIPFESTTAPEPGYGGTVIEDNSTQTTKYYFYDLTFKITDTATIHLPNSGGVSPYIFILIGAGFIVIALCSYFTYRHFKKRSLIHTK